MVPTQLKMLSPSGNALMPASALVCGARGGRGGSVTGKHGFAERANARRVGGNCVRFGWNDAVEVAC